MQNFKPPQPKPQLKEEHKVEVPIEQVKMIEPDEPEAKKEPEIPTEDSMQERVFTYIKLLDNELRVAAFDDQ